MCFGLPRIIDLNGQKPPLTYKRFQAIISRMELPKKPVGAVSSQQMESCRAEIRENHDDTYGVPSLEELGVYVLHQVIRAAASCGIWLSCFCLSELENTGLLAHACDLRTWETETEETDQLGPRRTCLKNKQIKTRKSCY